MVLQITLPINLDANVDDGSCEYSMMSLVLMLVQHTAVGTAIADCGDFAAGPNATWTHVLQQEQQ